MGVDKAQALIKVINKIPKFSDLAEANVRIILQVCEFRQVGADDFVCKAGEQSDEMLVLLSGQLGVFTEENVSIATSEPVAPVGEMGLITGQPRSATVKALAASNMLVVKKMVFDRLMRSNGRVCIQVYRNVMETLWGRLQESKQQHLQAEDECNELVGKLGTVEQEIQALRERR